MWATRNLRPRCWHLLNYGITPSCHRHVNHRQNQETSHARIAAPTTLRVHRCLRQFAHRAARQPEDPEPQLEGRMYEQHRRATMPSAAKRGTPPVPKALGTLAVPGCCIPSRPSSLAVAGPYLGRAVAITGALTTPPGSPRILIHTRQGRLQRACAATIMATGVLTAEPTAAAFACQCAVAIGSRLHDSSCQQPKEGLLCLAASDVGSS
jgi:hypothetical protein